MSRGAKQNAAVGRAGTNPFPQQELSFINVGGPTDAKTAAARREVRAEAARRSADQRRATIAKRYGCHSAARKAGKESNEKKSGRHHWTIGPDKPHKKQSKSRVTSICAVEKSSSSTASADTCTASLPTPPREPIMLESEPETLDIALPTGFDPQMASVSESIARSCSASADSILQTAVTNGQDPIVVWPAQDRPISCLAEHNALLPVSCEDDFMIGSMPVDINMITPPVESPGASTPPIPMPSTPAGLLHISHATAQVHPPAGPMLPAGLASLRERRLLPDDLLFAVAQTIYASPKPEAVWMSHGIASALFAQHITQTQNFADDELNAHVAMHVRLAAGLLVDMAAPGVVEFLPHAISEQQQHVGLLNLGIMMGTAFDDILLWSLVVIWAAKGRASRQQFAALQQLVEAKGIDSAPAFTAFMEQYVCPQWLRPAVQDLWQDLNYSLVLDGNIAARSRDMSALTWQHCGDSSMGH